MPITVEAPTPNIKQLSGKDPNGALLLSVLVRHTYHQDSEGRWVLAPEQQPLVGGLVENEAGELIADPDLFPWKGKTDLVLQGHAYGRGRDQFDVNIWVSGQSVKKIRVIGNREVAALGNGEIYFGPPAVVGKIPLSYTRAYGGTDKAAEATGPNGWLKTAKELSLPEDEIQLMNVYRYPRNPLGRGYLIEATVEAIHQIALPNLEDPLDLLTPKRLTVHNPGYWHRMPLPQSTGWLDSGWFPRLAYMGACQGTLDEPKSIAEIDRGFAPKNILERRDMSTDDIFRLIQGASLGLQLPHFRGGETITIDNVTPDGNRFGFRVPERPKIWVDGRRGTMKETEPVIHTVVVEPDLKRVSIVWRGAAPAIRPYLPDELAKMPLKVVWG